MGAAEKGIRTGVSFPGHPVWGVRKFELIEPDHLRHTEFSLHPPPSLEETECLEH